MLGSYLTGAFSVPGCRNDAFRRPGPPGLVSAA